MTCGILVPWAGSNTGPWQWELGVLTTEAPGNSLHLFWSVIRSKIKTLFLYQEKVYLYKLLGIRRKEGKKKEIEWKSELASTYLAGSTTPDISSFICFHTWNPSSEGFYQIFRQHSLRYREHLEKNSILVFWNYYHLGVKVWMKRPCWLNIDLFL